MFVNYNTFKGIGYLPYKYIMEHDPYPHSYFSFGKYDNPTYSWLHISNETERTKLFFSDRDPQFVRRENPEVRRKGNSDQ